MNATPIDRSKTPMYGWVQSINERAIMATIGKARPIPLNNLRTYFFDNLPVDIILSPRRLDIIMKTQHVKNGNDDIRPF